MVLQACPIRVNKTSRIRSATLFCVANDGCRFGCVRPTGSARNRSSDTLPSAVPILLGRVVQNELSIRLII